MLSDIKHILIADDDEDDVTLFQEAVDEVCPTLEVTVADDGVKLLSVLNTIPKPDAILLDFNMTKKSGAQCLEEIRAKNDYDVVPIAILSTSNFQNEIDYCLKKGANYYFVKPQSFDGMKLLVKNICTAVLTKRN